MISGDVIIGNKVFTSDQDRVVSGIITECIDKETVRIHFDAPYYGTAGRFIKDCYSTEEECKAAIEQTSKENFEYCYNSIKDVNDLINFALNNNISQSEYTDYNARNAYIKRAKELGFNISKE